MLRNTIWALSITFLLGASQASAEEASSDGAPDDEQELEPAEPETDSSREEVEAAEETGEPSGDVDESETDTSTAEQELEATAPETDSSPEEVEAAEDTGEPSGDVGLSRGAATGDQLQLSQPGTGEGPGAPALDIGLAETFRTHRQRHRTGVALSVVSAVLVPIGIGLPFSFYLGPLVVGAISLLSGIALMNAGIVLAAQGLRRARESLGVETRMGMRAMRRIVEDEESVQLTMAQTRNRRLELAGWIIFSIGMAAVAPALFLLDTTVGIAFAIGGSSMAAIGLPMGVVGTYRRRRAERQREHAEAMYPEQPLFGLQPSAAFSF